MCFSWNGNVFEMVELVGVYSVAIFGALTCCLSEPEYSNAVPAISDI